MMFLFVNASVCVRLPSDSTSQWTPLSFANSSYYQACNGLSPSSCYPCQAHYKNVICHLIVRTTYYAFGNYFDFLLNRCSCNCINASRCGSKYTSRISL
ncbi:hypothetical protein CEQ34_010810 [Staphylococcus aureus]|nr:hypothetical protein CEQ34_010810 [Staphylococcus aureus]